jgi:hypothetical protein
VDDSGDGDATPCRMTELTFHSHVRYTEIYVCLERPSGAPSQEEVGPEDSVGPTFPEKLEPAEEFIPMSMSRPTPTPLLSCVCVCVCVCVCLCVYDCVLVCWCAGVLVC